MRLYYIFIALLLACALSGAAPAQARPAPYAFGKIKVWNDQISSGITPAQRAFAATHYIGSQKQTRSEARAFRRYNPDFLVLHYRLALGDYPPSTGLIIRGDEWTSDWSYVDTQPWFYLDPSTASRVLNLDWNWYLMDPDSGWGSYWPTTVLEEVEMNEDDGVFADSISVPAYLGADRFDPPFPDVDEAAEAEWSAKIERLIAAYQAADTRRRYLIANVGAWVTSRELTDYSGADGVMVEGFAQWDQDTPFDVGDWRLQMNRMIAAAKRDRIIIAQAYLDSSRLNDRRSRGLIMASFLLTKGRRSFINMDIGMEPEWFPEYRLRLGKPRAPLKSSVLDYRDRASGVYRRWYDNGLVLVNPTNRTRTFALPRPMRRARPSGGGFVGPNGREPGSLSYTEKTSVTLAPASGAVLLEK